MEDAPTAPSPPESAISITSLREEESEPPKKARRTFLTQNACTRCRQKKSKCDGRRPCCGRCEKNSAQCIYDVAQEGLTRMQNLQQLLDKKSEDFDRVMLLFSAFQQGSDELATNFLARMRMGESIESLVQEMEMPQMATTGDAQDMSDSQDSRSMHSWPSSPLDQAGWNTWNMHSPQSGSSSFYSYPAPRQQAQVNGEGSRQEQGPYYQAQSTEDADADADGVEEPQRPPNPPSDFAISQRPGRRGSRR